MQSGRTGLVNFSRKVAGPSASAIKYDILTALLVTAARGDPVEARLALRLSLLITARFNWRLGTFSVGLKEIARMWGVTERTAKREMAEMRTRRWLVVAVPAARGRVAQYRIELPTVIKMTMPHWDAVGSDFAARMVGAPEPVEQETTNVVPLRREADQLPEEDGTGWRDASLRLQAQEPAVYSSWFAPLQSLELESGILTLVAPSKFVADYVKTHFQSRILAALLADDRSIREVLIIPPQR